MLWASGCALHAPARRFRLELKHSRIVCVECRHCDIEKTQVDTLRKYAEAVGGSLRVEIEIDGDRYQIA